MVNRAAVRPPLARIRLGMKRAELEVSGVGRENGGQAMRPSIEGTEFGSITISGERYEHDVVIRLSGKVKKRKKKIYYLVSQKQIPHLKLRRNVRIRESDLQKWLELQTAKVPTNLQKFDTE
jgi:excisionase family DNA binding protein